MKSRMIIAAIALSSALVACQKPATNDANSTMANDGSAAPAAIETPPPEILPDIAALGPTVHDMWNDWLSHRFAGGTRSDIHVSKSDGQHAVIEGTPGYRMFLTITVKMPNGYRPECVHQLCLLGEGPPPSGPVVFTYPAIAEFTKTERGWLAERLNVNFSRPQRIEASAPDPAGQADLANTTPVK